MPEMLHDDRRALPIVDGDAAASRLSPPGGTMRLWFARAGIGRIPALRLAEPPDSRSQVSQMALVPISRW